METEAVAQHMGKLSDGHFGRRVLGADAGH